MRKRVLIGSVAAIIAILYFTGRLDHALYPVGLNFHTCARNGLGATFCGSELTEYENRIHGVQQQISAIQQQAQQTEQSITSSESAAQQSIAQQMCQADPNSSLCGSP